MNQPIKLLTEVEYFRDQRPWAEHRTVSPAWHDVEAAVRRMDNFCFPFVQLHPTDGDDAEDTLYIIGNSGRYTMSRMMGEWQCLDETSGDAPVHL